MKTMPASTENNIPTLTDVVRTNTVAKKETVTSTKDLKTEESNLDNEPALDLALPDRKLLEQLISNRLQQIVPQISQELADEILSELEHTSRKRTAKNTGKSKTRR